MKKLLISSLTLVSLLTGASVARGTPDPIIVDDFTEFLSSPVQVVSPDELFAISEDEGLSTTSVLGGTRLTTLEILEPISGGSDGDITEVTSGSTDTGVLDQSIFGGEGNFTKTMVTWNGGAGLNQDVSEYDRFELVVNLFDLYDSSPNDLDIGTITIRVSNSLGGPFSELSKTLDEIGEAADPVTFRFYFSEFSDPTFFTNAIQEIQLEITGQQGLLFTIEEITINTPEPSLGISLLALAGVPVVVRGWRKRK
jgi:FlaG/FlaF family flagellin (archaellin)